MNHPIMSSIPSPSSIYSLSLHGNTTALLALLTHYSHPNHAFIPSNHTPNHTLNTSSNTSLIPSLIPSNISPTIVSPSPHFPPQNSIDSYVLSFINTPDLQHGMPPLHWAANGGKIETMRVLLLHGANVNAVDECDHITALFIVCARGYSVCAQLLLDHHADVNIVNEFHESALHVACWAGHVICVQLLLSYSSSSSSLSSKEGNVYANDVGENKQERQKVLVNIQDKQRGETPLHQATIGGHLQCIALLLRHGAAINIRNRKGWTPLHCAAIYDHLDCFQKLLDAGADVTTRGLDNRRLFQFFRSKKSRDKALLTSEFTFDQLSHQHFDLWFYLLRLTNVVGLEARIAYFVNKFPALATAKDHAGRSAIDVASPTNKLELQSHYLWHGRFRLLQELPEYASNTCVVYRVVDEHLAAHSADLVDPELAAVGQSPGEASSHSHHEFVLKLLRNRTKFKQELLMRQAHQFHPDYVVDIVMSNPPVDANLTHFPEELNVDMMAFTSMDRVPDDTNPAISSSSNALIKHIAESMYCLVMPCANRTLSWWLASEFAMGSSNLSLSNAVTASALVVNSQRTHEIRSMFKQIVDAVEYLHSNGLIHGDLSPQNIVLQNRRWKLIDLDAACYIGSQYINCAATSSAYLPPESVLITRSDLQPRITNDLLPAVSTQSMIAIGREFETPQKPPPTSVYSASIKTIPKSGADINAQATSILDVDTNSHVVAHPSYDVWSLGCILYHMCSVNSSPLFSSTKRDTLAAIACEYEGENPLKVLWNDDSLWTIASWSPPVKRLKLSKIVDPVARNLLNQLLCREWDRRPSLLRLAAHPFLSLRDVPRLIGEQPVYDVFLSHRSLVDESLAEAVRNMLVERGVRVYWERMATRRSNNLFGTDEQSDVGSNSGNKKSEQFSPARQAALASASVYVPIISRSSVNNSFDYDHNFSGLDAQSPVDPLLLEFRLALELLDAGLLVKMIPVMAGDMVRRFGASAVFSSFFDGDCCPLCRHEPVLAVEEAFYNAIDKLGLGSPNLVEQTIHDTLGAIFSQPDTLVLSGTRESAPEIILDAVLALLAAIEIDTDLISSPNDVPRIANSPYETDRRISMSSTAVNILTTAPAFLDEATLDSPDVSPEHVSRLFQAMSVEIKSQRDENRMLRQQLVPIMDREQQLAAELDRKRRESAPDKLSPSRASPNLYPQGEGNELEIASPKKSGTAATAAAARFIFDPHTMMDDSMDIYRTTSTGAAQCGSAAISTAFSMLRKALEYI